MKPCNSRLAGLLLIIAALVMPAHAATDPSFLLTGTAENFGTYFPSYLANGYFSTMTSVRGTEGNRAYMVAFMDYKPGDIARPAAIPGWSEIDYNPGGGWLNSTRIDKQIFADYAQTLDMHDGTLVDPLPLRVRQQGDRHPGHHVRQPGLESPGGDAALHHAAVRRHRCS